jgi:eukaryotic-like serine/threonine-protein kinase
VQAEINEFYRCYKKLTTFLLQPKSELPINPCPVWNDLFLFQEGIVVESFIPNSDRDWTAFIGRELGNVTIIKELGRGVMGVVFVAYQKTLKRQVAVKVLIKGSSTVDMARQMFRDEGELAAGLSHPNIIPIFEMGEVTDCYYQVMQLVDGTDLKTILRRQAKHPVPSRRILPRGETLDIIIHILDALGYAHEEGVVHQDIKPANILMEHRTQRPLVADFGIARALAGEYVSEGFVVGTPLYMSPEQVACEGTDGRSDIYSVGVMLFEMAAGSLPVHPGEKVEQILLRKKNAPDTFFTARPGQVSSAIDKELERIIMKAIATKPQHRYPECQDFIDDLEKYRKANNLIVNAGARGEEL